MSRRRTRGLFALLLIVFPLGHGSAVAGPGALRVAEDLNPDPGVLEVNISARKARVDLTGDGLEANAYSYNGTIPGPELRARVGDTVIVHFDNQLPEPTLIHWHGIELDNPNDGASLTQNLIPAGGRFTYRFRVTRPGVFWYHPHAMPTNQLFKGMYGSLIVEDPHEETLTDLGVLPGPSATRTLVLSDITVCKAPGSNDADTFRAGSEMPWVFTGKYGPFPGLTQYPGPRDLCEQPRDDHGHAMDSGPLAAGDIPNIQPAANCLPPRVSCRVNEGQLVLSNGRVATPRAGTPEAPGELAGNAGAITARAGEGVRLQLVNAAAARYFRLRLTDQQGEDVPLFRVGGQGGLLDRVRIEGGSIGTLDAKFDAGQIVLASAERADVVIVAHGEPGDVMTLWTEDFQHYGTLEYPFGYGALPTVPVAHIRIGEGGPPAEPFSIAAGDPLRLHPAVDDPVLKLREQDVTGQFVDPAGLVPPRPGSRDPIILLTVVGRESIDGVHGMALEGEPDGSHDYRDIPHIASSRYARLGDTIEMTVRNGTQMHHPWHLHGFSYQPVRIEDSLGELVYKYDYNEFVDTLDIPSTHRLVLRVHLEDRGAVDGPASGGAIGRWMMHCHIFHHNGVGMMTELVVLPAIDADEVDAASGPQ